MASLELLDDARAMLAVLRVSMYLVCFIHILDVCTLDKEHGVYYGEYVVEGADLVVTNSPYSIKQVREDRQSNYDKFRVDDM